MLITNLDGFVPISAYILNNSNPREIRILWLQYDLTWVKDPLLRINRTLTVEDHPTPVLMLDNTIIGLN